MIHGWKQQDPAEGAALLNSTVSSLNATTQVLTDCGPQGAQAPKLLRWDAGLLRPLLEAPASVPAAGAGTWAADVLLDSNSDADSSDEDLLDNDALDWRAKQI